MKITFTYTFQRPTQGDPGFSQYTLDRDIEVAGAPSESGYPAHTQLAEAEAAFRSWFGSSVPGGRLISREAKSADKRILFSTYRCTLPL
jgi:hypothetical protein